MTQRIGYSYSMATGEQEVGLLAALLQQLTANCDELTSIEGKVGLLQARARQLRQLNAEIENEIHVARLQSGFIPLPTKGPPSLRNFGMLRAWAAIRDHLSSRDNAGATHHALSDAIRRAIPGVPDPTVRSYLHRFKKKGFISQQGSQWQLVAADRSDPSHEDEGAPR